MFKKLFGNFLALVLLAAPASAQQTAAADRSAPGGGRAPDAARLRRHVEYLASDELDGRRTGTRGAESAARYIAEEFRRLGLKPGGGAGRHNSEAQAYLQTFPYVAGVELGKRNALTLTEADVTLELRVGEDWMPLGFSASGRAENAPVALAGYGIAAPELGHDDYAGRNVSGRIVVAFAGTPDGDNPHGKFGRYTDLRFKAAAARAAGARALIVVAAEENFKQDRLSRLSYDNSVGDAGLPVVALSRWAAARLLGLGAGARLDELEKSARARASAAPPNSPGADVSAAPSAPPSGYRLTVSTDLVRREAPAANVVGLLEGSDPLLGGEVVVVGAHYDHLGRGGRGSLAAREGEVHHGADDNASGTAGLLELARLFAGARERPRRTIVFAAFAGEEDGLLGSSHYVNYPALPLERTVAMFNMDMIGRLRGDALMIGGVGTAAEWRAMIEQANRGWKVELAAAKKAPEADGAGASPEPAAGSTSKSPPENYGKVVVTGTNGDVVATAVPARRFDLRLNDDGFGPSDHSSFYARRVPVLFFFTGAHEDYHKPTDTAERLNYEGAGVVVAFVHDLVEAVQSSARRPAFTQSKAESGARSAGFRVYLGTVPSYGESTDGMKLDAVREGSPAEAAGLKAGDRVVRLAGRDVRNVYDYTQALSEMKAGQEYEVEVLRDARRLTLKITPAARR